MEKTGEIIDMCCLDERWTAGMTDAGMLKLFLAGSERALSLPRVATFRLFQMLGSNKHLLPASDWRSRILVWRPEVVEEQMPVEAVRYWKTLGAGRLYRNAEMRDHHGLAYNIGYSIESNVFVLVPEHLLTARYRECLLDLARQITNSQNVQAVANCLEKFDLAEHGQTWEAHCSQEAHERARQVPYWLDAAGPEPNPDPNDARRLERVP